MTRASLALLSALLFVAAPAAAAEPLEDARLGALVDALDADLEALASAECDVACAALESMRRSADEICALDPGERCASSREKVDAATERVRARCPECDLGDEDDDEEDAAVGEPGGDASVGRDRIEEERTPAEPMTSAAPASEAPGAGCAACAVHRPTSPSSGWLAWVALVGAFVLRRRR